eukprot:scaffold172_cov341-Pavlova_lutheri.AAC.11
MFHNASELYKGAVFTHAPSVEYDRSLVAVPDIQSCSSYHHSSMLPNKCDPVGRPPAHSASKPERPTPDFQSHRGLLVQLVDKQHQVFESKASMGTSHPDR